jgi:RimJ/RimL family protein N-acetyltransferase
MSNFVPGKTVFVFKNKLNQEVILRYPKWQDLYSLTDYINKISAENTYLSMSGEFFSFYDEANYLSSKFNQMEFNNSATLFAVYLDRVIGICNVDKDFNSRARGEHRANLGITVDKDFRSTGIGLELINQTIKEAIIKIKGLKIIQLQLFGSNTKAHNLYTKIGFKEYGRLKKGLLMNDSFDDEVLMSLEI